MPFCVNEQRIDDEQIRAESARIRDQVRREAPHLDELSVELRAREWAREQLIEQVLLEQAAPQVQGIQARVPRPKPKEVTAFYHRFPGLFETPEMLRAAHIVKNVDETASEEQAEAAIREVEKQLQEGTDFAELADRCSDCPGSGGDLGFFARGQMVDEFEAAVSILRPGEVTGVFRSPFGFHIAKLLDRRPAGRRSLSEARADIEAHLWNEKKQRATEEFIRDLRARAVIRKV